MIYCPYPDIAFWEVLDCMTVKTMCYEFSATKIDISRRGKTPCCIGLSRLSPRNILSRKATCSPKTKPN